MRQRDINRLKPGAKLWIIVSASQLSRSYLEFFDHLIEITLLSNPIDYGYCILARCRLSDKQEYNLSIYKDSIFKNREKARTKYKATIESDYKSLKEQLNRFKELINSYPWLQIEDVAND